jgi:hypothetical protein
MELMLKARASYFGSKHTLSIQPGCILIFAMEFSSMREPATPGVMKRAVLQNSLPSICRKIAMVVIGHSLSVEVRPLKRNCGKPCC